MPNDVVVQVRMSGKTKTGAERIFRRLGMSTSDAVRIFFAQTVEEKGLPFHPRIPNDDTLAAMEECRAGRGETVPISRLKNRILGKA